MNKKKVSLRKIKGLTKVSKTKKAKWFSPFFKTRQKVSKSIMASSHANRLIALRPSLPKEVFWAFLKLNRSKLSSVSKEGVTLKRVSTMGTVGNHFFNLEVGKRKFFVKVSQNSLVKEKFLPEYDLAFSQFRALKGLKKQLKKLPPPYKKLFDVVSPEFAFVSGKYSFLVTKHVNLKTVDQILKEKSALSEHVSKFLPQLNELNVYLHGEGYFDALPHNMFFSPKNNKFILFDVRRDFGDRYK